jgi:hypothetical protein
VKRNETLRSHLSCKFESMAIGAVSPSNTALVFVFSILTVMNEKIGIDRQIIARNPIRSRPSAVQKAEGGLMITQIADDAPFRLYSIPHGRTRMADKRGSDSEWTDVKDWTWNLVTENTRQVTEVYWKKRR